jgi:hypothetical protein
LQLFTIKHALIVNLFRKVYLFVLADLALEFKHISMGFKGSEHVLADVTEIDAEDVEVLLSGVCLLVLLGIIDSTIAIAGVLL